MDFLIADGDRVFTNTAGRNRHGCGVADLVELHRRTIGFNVGFVKHRLLITTKAVYANRFSAVGDRNRKGIAAASSFIFRLNPYECKLTVLLLLAERH